MNESFIKTICQITALTVTLTLKLDAGVSSAEQTRLVKLELELGLKRAAGLGNQHPVIRRIETSIKMIERKDPAVRNGSYRILLERNRVKLEDEQVRLIDNGFGGNHPERREIKVQLAETKRRLAALK